jgi:uncharacterized membrane protein YdjX (TVP38/TMEM64 family)
MLKNPRVLALLGALAVLLGLAVILPVGDWLTGGLAWIQQHRDIAWLVFIGLYIVATVLMLPGLILTITAGFIFGLVAGVALVSVSSVLGATAAFLLGRSLAREAIAGRVSAWPRFAALDRAIEGRGFLIVLLVRLSPVFPFNLLNYALGLTGVKLRHYVLASWIGMLPATILYVWAGTLAGTLATAAAGEVETGLAGQLLLALGLIATLAVTIVVTKLARRELDRQLEAAAPARPAEEFPHG